MKHKETIFNKYLTEIGYNIKTYRIKRGLSLEKLGFDIGLDKSNMFRIEKGQNITLLTLIKIALILDIKPEVLIKVEHLPTFEDVDRILIVKQKRRNKS